ncbi:MAG TPA: hypothetical protein VKA68_08835, partial [bacterium]|nr:hypothetical protein [bacterium]
IETTFRDPSDELVRDARAVHSLIYDIRTSATQQFTTTRSTTHIVNLAALLVSVFLSVIIAGYLSDKITNHIHHPS